MRQHREAFSPVPGSAVEDLLTDQHTLQILADASHGLVGLKARAEELLSAAETQLADTAQQLQDVRAELQALRESSASEMEALRRQHAVERTQLQHELEQLRGRLVKRLTDSVDMLEVGLSALSKDTPRVPVMVERAEHVVDALRAEVQELRE